MSILGTFCDDWEIRRIIQNIVNITLFMSCLSSKFGVQVFVSYNISLRKGFRLGTGNEQTEFDLRYGK